MTTGSEDYRKRIITTSSLALETKIDVSDVAVSHTLQADTLAVEIYNHGSNQIYREIDGTATNESRPIRPRSSQSIDIKADEISLICDTDETAQVWISELK